MAGVVFAMAAHQQMRQMHEHMQKMMGPGGMMGPIRDRLVRPAGVKGGRGPLAGSQS